MLDAPAAPRATPPDGSADPGRRLFTVAECVRMLDAEIIPGDERFELIEGDIISMSPLHHAHEAIKSSLIEALVDAIDRKRWRVGSETSLYLDELSFLNPDVSVIPRATPTHEVMARDTALIVEISDSTLRRDKLRKAPLYARHGAPVFWLIDVNARTIAVHEAPVDGVWSRVRVLTGTDELTVPALPGFSFRLADAT